MSKKAPNLLIITPDQLRADFLGCYGHPIAKTPHIDRLAGSGVRFSQAYCASPACGPSRISFTTSTYVGEHGHRSYGSVCSPDVPNLVTSLKAHGYRTGMFGKNHLFHYHRLPELWDELDLVQLGNYDHHPDFKQAYSAFTLADDDSYNVTGRLAQNASAFVSSNHGEQPFFCWVNFQDPHPAYCCPAPYDRMFDPESLSLPESWRGYDKDRQPVRNEVFRRHTRMEECDDAMMRKALATYLGQIAYVDDAVGLMMESLEDSGLLDNTLVLFFSDHGELAGDYGMTHKLPAFYESLTRIPVILSAPWKGWKRGLFQGLLEEVDLVPTILDILGISIPPTMVGRSWSGALDAGDDTGKDSILVEAGGGGPTTRIPVSDLHLKAPLAPTNLGPGAMVRCGDWKLSCYHDDLTELYHLAEDPQELNNLAENPDYAGQLLEMSLLLNRRLLGVKVRDISGAWPQASGRDVRYEPLEGPDGVSLAESGVSAVTNHRLKSALAKKALEPIEPIQ